MVKVLAVPAGRGAARVELHPGKAGTGLLALGHGAGGDVTAPDLTAARDAALAAGLTVALITQPYRVAGRRAPAPAHHLDDAWLEVLAALPKLLPKRMRSGPLVVGGRSSGARVACRTAAQCGATGVLALAFPLHPPGKPEKSRADELPRDLPTLVINGDRDPFGVPEPENQVEVVVLPGARHDLKQDLAAVAAAVSEWLAKHGMFWPGHSVTHS